MQRGKNGIARHRSRRYGNASTFAYFLPLPLFPLRSYRGKIYRHRGSVKRYHMGKITKNYAKITNEPFLSKRPKYNVRPILARKEYIVTQILFNTPLQRDRQTNRQTEREKDNSHCSARCNAISQDDRPQ